MLKTVCGNSSWLTPRAAEFAYVVALEGMHHLTPMQVGRGQNLYAQRLNIMDPYFWVKRRLPSVLRLYKLLTLPGEQKSMWD